MSPIPPILHLLGLAVGVLGSLALMAKIAPDLPSGEPGVAEAGETQVAGPEDPQSILSAAGFSTALAQIRGQLGDDEVVISLTATPGSMDIESTESGSAEGVEIDQISFSTSYLIASQIAAQRKERLGLSDVRGEADLAALSMSTGPSGPIWIATLRSGVAPPRRYRAIVPGPSAVAFQVKVRPLGTS